MRGESDRIILSVCCPGHSGTPSHLGSIPVVPNIESITIEVPAFSVIECHLPAAKKATLVIQIKIDFFVGQGIRRRQRFVYGGAEFRRPIDGQLILIQVAIEQLVDFIAADRPLLVRFRQPDDGQSLYKDAAGDRGLHAVRSGGLHCHYYYSVADHHARSDILR